MFLRLSKVGETVFRRPKLGKVGETNVFLRPEAGEIIICF